MIRLAILFAVISMLAAAFGFYGVSNASADIAKFIALVFAVMFIAAIAIGVAAARKVT
ncbi:DUF1328 domain-containing protein [Paludisphaera rhizosphaerae]|uniref:DUF1328 domain-containing protein n=1 Tax=Paludisphaera rhizosphaerae TaxID=2711216 RepID=UPI0013EDB222|nr:DUF1328 domain-containing protein [Paludisphaera rhizosphaerae]